MTEPGEQPAAPRAVSIAESGAVTVGGEITISGAVAAGRDVVIERLSVIADDWAPAGDAATRPGSAADVCPYPGIQPFGEEQRAWFIGRDRDRRIALERLAQSDFLAVIGGSGSGKSSLLAAGIGPDFVDATKELGETWKVRHLRPGPRPATLLRSLVANAEASPSLWLVDQLEEAFTRAVDEQERAGFLDELLDLAAGRRGVAKVVVALRSDFYPVLDAHRGIADAVAGEQHRLLPLDADALRDVILCPADLVGLRVEPALVQQVLADLEPGTNQLPLLAYAMRETWRRRRNGWLTLAGYVDAGGVGEALENGARSVWDGLAADQRETARRIFLRLTSAGEGRAATRQRVTVDDLVTDRDNIDAVVDVLERFTRQRLIVPDQDDAGRPTVDIAHEALLREWSVLGGWLDDDLEVRRLQRQLADAARDWDEGGREPTGLFAGRRLQAVRDGRRAGDITVNSSELAFIEAADRRERWDHRRTVLLTVLPLILVVALVIAGVIAVQQRRTADQKVVADSLQLASRSRSLIASQRDVAALLAIAAVRTDRNPTTLGTLADSVTDPGGPLAFPRIRSGTATALASSLTDDGAAVVGAADGSLRLVDPTSGRELSRIDTDLLSVSDVAVATDGTIVAGGSHGGVAVVPASRSDVVVLGDAQSTIAAVRFDPSSSLVVAGTVDGSLWRWRLGNDGPEPLPTVELDTGLLALEMTAIDGHVTITAATTAGTLQHVDAVTGEPLRALEEAFPAPLGVSLATTGGRLLVQSGHGVEVWDVSADEPLTFSDEFSGATAIAVVQSEAASLAFTGSTFGEVQAWTLDPRPIPVGPIRAGLTGRVERLATDGRTLVGLDDGGHLTSWDVGARRSPAGSTVVEHPAGVQAVSVAPSGDIASAGRAGKVVVTSPDGNSRTVADIAGVTGLAWLSGNTLLVGTGDGSVLMVDAATGRTDVLGSAGGGPIVDVAAGAESTVAYATADGAITVVDGGGRSRTVTAPATPIESLTLSHDGSIVAAGTSTAETFVWDLAEDAVEPMRLAGHSRQVTALAFSPDDDLLATGSDDTDIRLWSMPDGRELTALRGHSDMVESLVFSSAGDLLVSGGQDYTTRVWDVREAVQLGEPWRWAEATISSAALAADGRSIVAAHGNVVVRWSFDVDGWTDAACALAARDLTVEEWAEVAPNQNPITLCQPN